MVKYLAYKMLNNFLSGFTLRKVEPMLIPVKISNIELKGFHFDFSHETTHFGDRLFFLPLINYPTGITLFK